MWVSACECQSNGDNRGDEIENASTGCRGASDVSNVREQCIQGGNLGGHESIVVQILGKVGDG